MSLITPSILWMMILPIIALPYPAVYRLFTVTMPASNLKSEISGKQKNLESLKRRLDSELSMTTSNLEAELAQLYRNKEICTAQLLR